MTHAFFKALLFLAAGSVIIAMHHEQDMRKMGGLRKQMPWTFGTCLVGVAGYRIAGWGFVDAVYMVVITLSTDTARMARLRFLLSLLGLAILLSLAVVAIVWPSLRDYGPNEYIGPGGQAPSSEYWFGTTTFGQDVFVQFVHGLGATFFVGIGSWS